ncbi:MAG TPA: hypothetical protein VNA14_09010 [Mycobacteriales bacterium]|nr:hypothetical protein [Mycobacteriales bacterium]
MIVLGLLLIAAAAAFGVELFVSNNSAEVLGEAFGQDITRLSAGGYFLLGSATTVALLFGILLVDGGLRRTRSRKAKREEFEARQLELARQAQSEKAEAVSEAERLRDELVDERMSQATLGGVVMPPDIESPGEVSSGPATPVDDPEHAEEDHRGILGRLRHDRSELPPEPAGAASRAETANAVGHVPQSDTSMPRPDAATDAFNAALAAHPERRPPPD